MVLGRIASNFVSVERERRQTMKNENTPPSKANRGIRSAFSQKIVSSLSSISAASRRRRARLHGGLEKDRHRVADSARRRDRTQSRSRTHTPPVTVASQSPPAMVDEEDRMETEDCEMSEVVPSVEPSAPAFRGVTLPRRLARPAYRPANTAALAAIEPGLAETNIEYVRDCLEATGARCVSLFLHSLWKRRTDEIYLCIVVLQHAECIGTYKRIIDLYKTHLRSIEPERWPRTEETRCSLVALGSNRTGRGHARRPPYTYAGSVQLSSCCESPYRRERSNSGQDPCLPATYSRSHAGSALRCSPAAPVIGPV